MREEGAIQSGVENNKYPPLITTEVLIKALQIPYMLKYLRYLLWEICYHSIPFPGIGQIHSIERSLSSAGQICLWGRVGGKAAGYYLDGSRGRDQVMLSSADCRVHPSISLPGDRPPTQRIEIW